MDAHNIPSTPGSTNREGLVLCRKHSCLVTHDNTVCTELTYQQDKINAKNAADSGLDLTAKKLQDASKLIEKVEQKKAKDAALAAAAASEVLRKSLLSKEQLAAERVEKSTQSRLKAAANKSAKELKAQEKTKKYEDALASIAAKNALDAV